MVDLLAEIQASATDPAVSLSDLLRKCQILAFRLQHEPLKTWVNHELNGYTEKASLPPYRNALIGTVKADLSGPFGSGAKNVPVPLSLIPEPFREDIEHFDFYQGVASLESLIESAKATGDTRIMTMFPVELAAATDIWQGYNTMLMWLEVPLASVAGVLDQVRSRALTFTLEIESENPKAGEAKAGDEPPVPVARTDVIFNNVIFGGNNAIGPGATVNVIAGDLGSLMAYLEAEGVEAEDRAALEAALDADQGLGERVKGWLGEMAAKTASVGGSVGKKAAIGVITAAVLKFLGLG